jgi:hypothetical protein
MAPEIPYHHHYYYHYPFGQGGCKIWR